MRQKAPLPSNKVWKSALLTGSLVLIVILLGKYGLDKNRGSSHRPRDVLYIASPMFVSPLLISQDGKAVAFTGAVRSEFGRRRVLFIVDLRTGDCIAKTNPPVGGFDYPEAWLNQTELLIYSPDGFYVFSTTERAKRFISESGRRTSWRKRVIPEVPGKEPLSIGSREIFIIDSNTAQHYVVRTNGKEIIRKHLPEPLEVAILSPSYRKFVGTCKGVCIHHIWIGDTFTGEVSRVHGDIKASLMSTITWSADEQYILLGAEDKLLKVDVSSGAVKEVFRFPPEYKRYYSVCRDPFNPDH